MSSIKVPDTGPRNVETTPQVQPDGSVLERQVIEIEDGLHLFNIRKMMEEMYFKFMFDDALPMPAGRSASFDEQGNLDVSDGVSISGGAKIFRLIALGSTNATMIKGSKGQVYGWYLYNAATSPRFVKLYNSFKTPNVGVDVPAMTLPLPSGAAANLWCSAGLGDFSQGIGIATTVNLADTDTTAVTANDLAINLWYS